MPVDALPLLVDAQAQAPAQGLASLALAAHLAQCANLEDVGVVPALLQGRVGEDELQQRAEAEQPLLLLHDEVIAPLGVGTAGLVLQAAFLVQIGVGPAALLVDGKVAVVHGGGFLRQIPSIWTGEQALEGRQLGRAPVLFLEDAGVVALHRVAVLVVLAVARHRLDEEQRQHLDALGPQQLLLLQVLLDGPPDHLALHGQGIHLAVGLPQGQVDLTAGVAQLHELFALGGADLADTEVAVHRPLGQLLEVVAVVDGQHLRLGASGRLHVQLHLGRDALLVAHLQQPHVGLVEGVLDGGRCHLDLLDQLALVGVHGIEPVHHVVLVGVGGRVAQGAQRLHRVQRGLARAAEAAVHALRLVHDDYRPRGANQVDGLLPAGLLAVLVEVVHLLLVDGAYRDHHDLDGGAGGEVAHLAQLAGVVQEEVHRHAGIDALEVLLGDLQRLVDAFLDGHRRHHDDELGEAVALVQLEDRAQVDVGLAGAGLHLNREVAGRQRAGRRQAVAQLHAAQVVQQLLIHQGQAVAQALVGVGHAQRQLLVGQLHSDSELGAADLLATEQVADRLDGLKLVVQVGFKVEFHQQADVLVSLDEPGATWRSKSGPPCSPVPQAARLTVSATSLWPATCSGRSQSVAA